MATNNAVNINATGIIKYDGAGTFTSTTTTNHNLLIGAASNAITNVAPSATSGVPVISQGSSADPIFGTAVVAGGGTGQTTLTNHGVLVGAGTSAITQLATGSAGQVLRSGGASADPAYSTATYPSTAGTSGNVLTSDGTNWNSSSVPSSFAPNSTIQIFDDFIGTCIGVVAGSELLSILAWSASSSSFLTNPTPDSAHPGILSTASLVGTPAYLFARTDIAASFTNSMVLGGGAITLNWVFKIATLSNSTNRYNLMFGMGDTTTAADQVNGCYIRYSDNVNSGNWQFVTAAASTRTTSNSSVAADTNWHNFTLTINAAATSVSYAIDGVSLGTAITTNIPTASLSPGALLQQVAGTIASGTLLIDLFYMTQTLTSAR